MKKAILSKEQIDVLNFLHECNKYRLDVINTLASFQRGFSKWLCGDESYLNEFKLHFKVWDDMEYSKRLEVCKLFLETGR